MELKNANKSPNKTTESIKSMTYFAGIDWFKAGIQLLMKHKLNWLTLGFCYAVIVIPFSLLPGLSFIFPIIHPLIIGVLYYGVYQFTHDKSNLDTFIISSKVLLKLKIKPLLTIGALNVGLNVAALVISLVVTLFSLILLSFFIPENSTKIVLIFSAILVFSLVWITLYSAIICGLLFAPAIVVFKGGDAWDAIIRSFKACIANMGALTIYSLVLLLPIVVILLPSVFYLFGVVSNIPFNFQSISYDEIISQVGFIYRNPKVWISLIIPASLILPLVITTLYSAYQSIFHSDFHFDLAE